MVHDVGWEGGMWAVGHNVRGWEECTAWQGLGVSRHLVVCQFTRVYESDGTRNRTGFEVAARREQKMEKPWLAKGLVFARAAGGETKGRGNIRSRHNRFHLLRRHRPGPDKNATPTKPFHRNLTSLSARSWRFSSRKELPYGHHSGNTERPYVWLGRSTVPPTRFPLLECFLN